MTRFSKDCHFFKQVHTLTGKYNHNERIVTTRQIRTIATDYTAASRKARTEAEADWRPPRAAKPTSGDDDDDIYGAAAASAAARAGNVIDDTRHERWRGGRPETLCFDCTATRANTERIRTADTRAATADRRSKNACCSRGAGGVGARQHHSCEPKTSQARASRRCVERRRRR